MGNQHFSIIFDTNILYNNYDKKADFTEFYFNTTFNNILDKIEEKDICSFIDVIIPEIVWSELKKHKIEKYEEKKEDYKSKILKFKFPNIEIKLSTFFMLKSSLSILKLSNLYRSLIIIAISFSSNNVKLLIILLFGLFINSFNFSICSSILSCVIVLLFSIIHIAK